MNSPKVLCWLTASTYRVGINPLKLQGKTAVSPASGRTLQGMIQAALLVQLPTRVPLHLLTVDAVAQARRNLEAHFQFPGAPGNDPFHDQTSGATLVPPRESMQMAAMSLLQDQP